MSSAPTTTAKKWARWALPITAAVVVAGGLTAAQAVTRTVTPTAATTSVSTSMSGMSGVGRGVNEFGLTVGNVHRSTSIFRYTNGFYCDTHVPAASSTKCEVGTKWKVAPSRQHDPLFITVPLGFNVPEMKMDCPSKLVCVDHPATIDLTRLATVLAPIFKTTPAALTPALRNFMTPGHDHFIIDKNNHKAEWWDVYVIGVTNAHTYADLQGHRSYSYIQALQRRHNPNITAAIPTNLFLYFAAK